MCCGEAEASSGFYDWRSRKANDHSCQALSYTVATECTSASKNTNIALISSQHDKNIITLITKTSEENYTWAAAPVDKVLWPGDWSQVRRGTSLNLVRFQSAIAKVRHSQGLP